MPSYPGACQNGVGTGKRMIAASRDVPMFGAKLTYVDAPSDNNVVTIESRHSKISGRVLGRDILVGRDLLHERGQFGVGHGRVVLNHLHLADGGQQVR